MPLGTSYSLDRTKPHALPMPRNQSAPPSSTNGIPKYGKAHHRLACGMPGLALGFGGAPRSFSCLLERLQELLRTCPWWRLGVKKHREEPSPHRNDTMQNWHRQRGIMLCVRNWYGGVWRRHIYLPGWVGASVVQKPGRHGARQWNIERGSWFHSTSRCTAVGSLPLRNCSWRNFQRAFLIDRWIPSSNRRRFALVDLLVLDRPAIGPWLSSR